MSSASCSKLDILSKGKQHPSLFDVPSKVGPHHTPSAHMCSEPRFQWQKRNNFSDAFYNLPTSFNSGPHFGMGTSTRDDWENMSRSKKDRSGANAGPGSYNAPSSVGKQCDSQRRSTPASSFQQAPRTPSNTSMLMNQDSNEGTTELKSTIGGGTNLSHAYGFGTGLREPLYRTKNRVPGPSLTHAPIGVRPRTTSASYSGNNSGSYDNNGSSGYGNVDFGSAGTATTFGLDQRSKSTLPSGNPGPIYNVDLTGFKTGPKGFAFSCQKRFAA